MEAAKQKVGSVVHQLTAALKTHGDLLNQSLQQGGLLPGPAIKDDLVPANFEPKIRLDLSYDGKAVDLGNLFRASECKVAPSVSFHRETPAEADKSGSAGGYTLMMVDPDAPTPDDPKFAFWRHWIVTGLQPLTGDERVVAATKFPVTEYHPPGPTADSKPHRYLFLLFREPGGLDGIELGNAFVERRSFEPAAFARRLGLVLVGVNWMRCAADDWSE